MLDSKLPGASHCSCSINMLIRALSNHSVGEGPPHPGLQLRLVVLHPFPAQGINEVSKVFKTTSHEATSIDNQQNL